MNSDQIESLRIDAGRIRGVKEGYIQAIEPEHSLFLRVRFEPTSQFAEMPVRPRSVEKGTSEIDTAPISAPIVPAAEADVALPATPGGTELRGSNLVQELEAIVGVLDHQLRLCSKSLKGNIDSCKRLLARAEVEPAYAACNRIAVARIGDEALITLAQ